MSERTQAEIDYGIACSALNTVIHDMRTRGDDARIQLAALERMGLHLRLEQSKRKTRELSEELK